MRLLALDQASYTSGFAIFDDGKLIKSGTINVTGDFGDRLTKIRKKVIEKIEEYNIDEVVFEDIQLQESAGNNIATFKKLAEVYGVIHELCYELKIPAHSFLASHWRSVLGINKGKDQHRTSKKPLDQKYVKDTYNLTVGEDEADAICIGAAYCKPTSAF